MTVNILRKMIGKFQETGSLSDRPGRGRKPIYTDIHGEVVLMGKENRTPNINFVHQRIVW